MVGSQSEELIISKDEMEKMSQLSAANARESAKSDPILDNLSKGSNKKGPQVITQKNPESAISFFGNLLKRNIPRGNRSKITYKKSSYGE